MVATVGEALVQVPPAIASLRVMFWPWQTLVEPVMGDVALMVIIVVAMQPVPVV